MPRSMRTLGEGSRFSVLVMAVAMLGGASACSTPEAVAKSESAASSPEPAGEPRQVVQNMKGQGTTSASERGDSAVAGGARASAAGVSRANGATLAPRSNAAETITSKHLEAELNRLEAELAN